MAQGEQAHAAGRLRIRALGDLVVEVDGARIEHRIPANAAALLVFLADSGGSASRTRIAGLLWSDQGEERARGNLRIALTRLRREVGDHVQSDRQSVRLTGPVDLDVGRVFDGDPQQVCDDYRGEFLVGVTFDDAPLFDDWVGLEALAARACQSRRIFASSA